tara:strand:+ start:4522 stop:5289 length:768 start_codon:yes stop_codon:yes gene_type:complete
MNRVKQAFVAPSIKFFKEKFLSNNNLIDYYDDTEPSVFFGASESSSLINKHKGYKIILPCHPTDYPSIQNYENTLFVCSDNYTLLTNVIRKSITPKIKNYDLFKPNPLGDKIYFYSGFKSKYDLFNGTIKDTIREIQKYVDYEIITTDHFDINNYYDIEFLKTNYYDKCFLNLNLTKGAGFSTVIELGLMGRKTIFNNPHSNNIQRMEFPNFIHYNDIEDIIKIISDESKKIGTIQDPIDAHNVGDEWLNLDFWL